MVKHTNVTVETPSGAPEKENSVARIRTPSTQAEEAVEQLQASEKLIAGELLSRKKKRKWRFDIMYVM